MTDTPVPFDPEAFRASLARFGEVARAEIAAKVAALQPLGEWARAVMESSAEAATALTRALLPGVGRLAAERDQARDEAGRLTGELARAEMEIERLRGHCE